MPGLDLFSPNQIVGVFRGFREGGLEFHADLVLPYRNEFQRIPMHGQFLLVQLENPDEAVLGRIASLSSEGKLAIGSGEEFSIRAVQEHRAVPENLREQYLKYRINIRVLGVLRNGAEGLEFVPSHRRLPHVGSPVAFPSADVLREIAGHGIDGAEIGHLAMGEYIYAQGSRQLHYESWMQLLSPEVLVKFPIENLVSRRSFIFARAGFGKSNLNKLLFSTLYQGNPTVTKRGGREVPVGTVIFDPDGEYFWPDDRGRPGFCDVEGLQDKLVVFTARQAPSPFYGCFVAGGVRLDIRRLNPSDVIGIALNQERQNQQNVRKLRNLDTGSWRKLVDLIDHEGHGASIEAIAELLRLDARQQEVEAFAARSNMVAIVRMLHDRNSRLMDLLLQALAAGKLCVVDLSQLRGGPSMVLAGLILRRIFDRNQQGFTSAQPDTIPTIVVIEEAQSVLQENAAAAEPFITWVKEGRKYDLGAVLVTQQPGSIPMEILSQGDNWFIFHLLASADLQNVRGANAHLSEDLLSSLLNEPIPGQGVFWSSAGGKPYPIALRTLLFEHMYQALDADYCRAAVDTYAGRLRRESLQSAVQQVVLATSHGPDGLDQNGLVLDDKAVHRGDDEIPDTLEILRMRAIRHLIDDADIMHQLENGGMPWGGLNRAVLEIMPEQMDKREDEAFHLVKPTLIAIFGEASIGWHTFVAPSGKRWVKKGPKPNQ